MLPLPVRYPLPSSRRRADGQGGHFDRQLRGSPEPLEGRCARKLPRTNPPRYCTQYPRRGRTACEFHGGKTLAGPAHPSWKGGTDWIAKAIPAAMRASYEDAVAAAELRTVRREIGIAAGLKAEVLDRLSQGGGSFAAWKRAAKLFKQVEEAADEATKAKVLQTLGRVLRSGAAQATAAADLQDVLELERRLRESESRMVFRMAGQVTIEQLLGLMKMNADLTLQAIALATRKGEQEARRWFAHEARALAAGQPALKIMQ